MVRQHRNKTTTVTALLAAILVLQLIEEQRTAS